MYFKTLSTVKNKAGYFLSKCREEGSKSDAVFDLSMDCNGLMSTMPRNSGFTLFCNSFNGGAGTEAVVKKYRETFISLANSCRKESGRFTVFPGPVIDGTGSPKKSK